jgi:hypothetical protein
VPEPTAIKPSAKRVLAASSCTVLRSECGLSTTTESTVAMLASACATRRPSASQVSDRSPGRGACRARAARSGPLPRRPGRARSRSAGPAGARPGRSRARASAEQIVDRGTDCHAPHLRQRDRLVKIRPPEGALAHADPAGHPGVGVGHVGGRAPVAGQDVADAVVEAAPDSWFMAVSLARPEASAERPRGANFPSRWLTPSPWMRRNKTLVGLFMPQKGPSTDRSDRALKEIKDGTFTCRLGGPACGADCPR